MARSSPPQTDYTADGLAHVWSLYDDGTVTLTGTARAAPSPPPLTADTVAQAQAFKTAQTATTNEGSDPPGCSPAPSRPRRHRHPAAGPPRSPLRHDRPPASPRSRLRPRASARNLRPVVAGACAGRCGPSDQPTAPPDPRVFTGDRRCAITVGDAERCPLLVRVFNADLGGCGHYRLIWPAQAAAAAGGNDGGRWPPTDVRRKRVDGGRVVDERRRRDRRRRRRHQRLVSRDVVDTIPHLQAAGVAVVVDIDDDLDALPKGHPYRAATSPARPLRRHADGYVDDPDAKNRLWLREACRQADLVTVSTPALAKRYARHGRVAVLP